MSLGLQPCSGAGNPHPLRSTLIVTQTSMASLGARIPAPLVRYHTIVICKGNHINSPTTRSPTQRFPSVKNLIKVPNYSFNKNSHILENGLVPPCSILLLFSFLNEKPFHLKSSVNINGYHSNLKMPICVT